MGAVKSEYEEEGYVPDQEEELVAKVTTTTKEKNDEN